MILNYKNYHVKRIRNFELGQLVMLSRRHKLSKIGNERKHGKLNEICFRITDINHKTFQVNLINLFNGKILTRVNYEKIIPFMDDQRVDYQLKLFYDVINKNNLNKQNKFNVNVYKEIDNVYESDFYYEDENSDKSEYDQNYLSFNDFSDRERTDSD